MDQHSSNTLLAVLSVTESDSSCCINCAIHCNSSICRQKAFKVLACVVKFIVFLQGNYLWIFPPRELPIHGTVDNSHEGKHYTSH